MYCCRVAALNEFMQWLSWMFLKDNCTGGGCTESRPLALYVVHSTCAWLLTGIFNCSELTLQSGFFLPESGKSNERKGGRSRSHTRSKSIQPMIEPRSPTLQVDSLPSEPPGKSKKTGVGSYPFSRGSFQPRNQIMVSYIAGRFFTSWATREAHKGS